MPEMPDLTNTDWITLYAIPWLTKGFWALAIFLIGKWLARMMAGLLSKAMTRAKVDTMLVGFMQNLAYYVMLVAVVLASISPRCWRWSVPPAWPSAWPSRTLWPTLPPA